MNPDIKQQWVAALRSGDYKKGEGFLRKEDNFCCLGVLCDLAIKAGVPVETVTTPVSLGDPNGPRMTRYNEDTGVLPQVVKDWAGLKSSNPLSAPVASNTPLEQMPLTIAEVNDQDETTFADIADIIEKVL